MTVDLAAKNFHKPTPRKKQLSNILGLELSRLYSYPSVWCAPSFEMSIRLGERIYILLISQPFYSGHIIHIPKMIYHYHGHWPWHDQAHCDATLLHLIQVFFSINMMGPKQKSLSMLSVSFFQWDSSRKMIDGHLIIVYFKI